MIQFENRVAIVTGAGNGLGRSHALGLAARGAKVIVNDYGGSVNGNGGASSAAQEVAQEILQAGGEALADDSDVSDFQQVTRMKNRAMDAFGRIDILVNNAGILRDKTFQKMAIDDFSKVMDVHLMGTVNCTKSVWDVMRAQGYGRIIMTSSSSGLYGNFGQSNYASAKMALIGLMNVLQLEGEKYGIRVNALAPSANTRMTEDLISDSARELMTVESVTPALLYLAHENAPSRVIMCAGGGRYSIARLYENEGIYLPPEDQSPENLVKNLDLLDSEDNQSTYFDAITHSREITKRAEAHLAEVAGYQPNQADLKE